MKFLIRTFPPFEFSICIESYVLKIVRTNIYCTTGYTAHALVDKMASPDFYLRYYVGHHGKFGHEFLEFEFRPDGKSELNVLLAI